MTAFLTSSTLISSVKRRALIPTSQSTFQPDDFLAFANEEIAMGILPTVLMYHEEYYVHSDDVPLVADQNEYPIPYRAIGGKLRNLQYRDVSGDLRELSRISPDDVQFYQQSNALSNVSRFYVKNNSIVLIPNITGSAVGSLVFSYYLRPNQLVQETRVAVITAIDTSTGVITVSSVPSNIATGDLVDLLEAKPGHRTLAFDVTASSVDSAAKTITVDPGDMPDSLAIGDHVALAGECMIPQVPSDLHVMLAQRVAARCLEALGDTTGLSNANAKIQEMELKTGMLIDNRVEGAPLKINNIRGLLRNAKVKRRRSFL